MENLPITPQSPQSCRPPKQPTVDSPTTKSNADWNFPTSNRNSVASNYTAVYQPRGSLIQSPASVETVVPTRVVNMAASSVYSTRSSTLIAESQFSHPRSQSIDSLTRNQSPSRRCSHSANSLARTHNSIRHSRKASPDSVKRRSRDQNQLHFDPRAHHRNRSGSIQGQAIDSTTRENLHSQTPI